MAALQQSKGRWFDSGSSDFFFTFFLFCPFYSVSFSPMQRVLHFNKSDFNSVKKLIAVKIANKQVSTVRYGLPFSFPLHSRIRKLLSDFIYVRPKTKVIFPAENDPSCRYILLKESIQDKSLSSIPEEVKSSVNDYVLDVVDYELKLNYDSYTAEEVSFCFWVLSIRFTIYRS